MSANEMSATETNGGQRAGLGIVMAIVAIVAIVGLLVGGWFLKTKLAGTPDVAKGPAKAATTQPVYVRDDSKADGSPALRAVVAVNVDPEKDWQAESFQYSTADQRRRARAVHVLEAIGTEAAVTVMKGVGFEGTPLRFPPDTSGFSNRGKK